MARIVNQVRKMRKGEGLTASPFRVILAAMEIHHYPGGKAGDGVYQTIINQIPPHDVYIEAFAGGGAILRKKRPARVSSIAIEIDAGPAAALSELEIPGLTVMIGDAISLVPACIANSGVAAGKVFVYCDPPYLFDVRTSGAMYVHEFGLERDHRRLLALIKALDCMVMISGYWSELYARELSGWRTVSFNAVVRSGEVRREWLWMNYPEPLALHDYTYLGENYRERERIKRKARRWRERFRGLDRLERRAILWGLREAGVLEERQI